MDNLLPQECARMVKIERKSPVLIFTDGAFEPDAEIEASMGGVLFDTASGHSEFFGEELASTLVEQ